jgi:hypothetical protein
MNNQVVGIDAPYPPTNGAAFGGKDSNLRETDVSINQKHFVPGRC